MLGVVAAIGIVTGASGAMLMTRGGTTAAEPTAETTVAVAATPEDALTAPTRAEADEAATAVATAQPERPRTAETPRAREVRQTAPRPAPRRSEAPAAAPVDAPVAAPQVQPAPAIVPAPAPVEQRASETVPAVEEPKFEDLVLPAQSVIGIQVDRTVSSETARVEDEVVGRVTRDVRVGDRVAIPAGSRATGSVTLVERGGKLKDRSRLGVRFTSVVLADGSRVPIDTEAIFREGDSPRNESAAKIGGGAIGGAILGGILGGAKGAAIGGSIGAGAGSAAVYTGGRNAAVLATGSPVTVRLESPATVTVER
jgi:type IV secretory pathway VirB10-like protein